MISSQPLMKTQQVARSLGVSGATVKRWVDAGIIQATRTAGKHRLVPISEVKRIASEIGAVPPAAGLVDSDVEVSGARNDQLVERLTSLLGAGDALGARALIRAVMRSGRDGAEVADGLIAPVMERIGHGWMTGSLDIYKEHVASSIVASAIQERIDELTFVRKGSARLALGATTEGDHYVLPGLLAELILRGSGWDVRNLGTNLPLRSLANAVRDTRPDLIFISVGYLKDKGRFLREYLDFHRAAADVDAAVILGGRALRPDLRSRLPYTAFGDRMSHLAEFSRRLAPRATTTDNAPSDRPPAGREISRSPEHHE